MIITFDGHSGSGKTTQSIKVARHLGLECVSFWTLQEIVDMYLLQVAGTPSKGIASVLRNLMAIRGMQDGHKGWNQHKGYVFENGFFSILSGFYNSGEKDLMLDLFLKALRLCNGQEPVLSFLLKTTYVESMYRVYRRQGRGSFLKERQDIDEYAKRDDKWSKFWEWLDSQLPYLYIIDGMQPEESVTADIMQILRKKEIKL